MKIIKVNKDSNKGIRQIKGIFGWNPILISDIEEKLLGCFLYSLRVLSQKDCPEGYSYKIISTKVIPNTNVSNDPHEPSQRKLNLIMLIPEFGEESYLYFKKLLQIAHEEAKILYVKTSFIVIPEKIITGEYVEPKHLRRKVSRERAKAA